jgi:hypothetical protein
MVFLSILILAGIAFFTHHEWLSALEHLGSTDASQQKACPGEVANAIPDGQNSKLVAAYLTRGYRVTLCATTRGRIYYNGVEKKHSHREITLRAHRKGSSYVARHNGYVYRVTKRHLIVTRHGSMLVDQTLHPRH